MKTDWKGDYYDKGDITETYMRQQLSIGVGELIYGLGECILSKPLSWTDR